MVPIEGVLAPTAVNRNKQSLHRMLERISINSCCMKWLRYQTVSSPETGRGTSKLPELVPNPFEYINMFKTSLETQEGITVERNKGANTDPRAY
jgi:hypothetical protein